MRQASLEHEVFDRELQLCAALAQTFDAPEQLEVLADGEQRVELGGLADEAAHLVRARLATHRLARGTRCQ